jgi:hypothetical protein
MGFFDTVKGWFNIGGVKVKIEGLNQVVSKSGSKINAKVNLTTKKDKLVNKVVYKFLLRKTTGSGEEKKTKDYTISESIHGEPFELRAGETKTLDLDLTYNLEKSLKDMGGVLGAVGKVGAFFSSDKEEYFVVAQADVKGAAFSPSHWIEVSVVA